MSMETRRRELARRYPGATGINVSDPAAPWYSGTVWTRDVRQMPVAANSPSLATWMHRNRLNRFIGPGRDKPFGDPTGLNRTAFGTDPIPAYVIDSSVPGTPRVTFRVGYATGDNRGEKTKYLEQDVPFPTHVVPARNQDKGLAIWDMHTGIVREWFHVEQEGPGRYKAIAGGWSHMEPGFRNLAASRYHTQLDVGTNSVVGMHNYLGFLDADEVLAGEIRHAVAFTASTFGWNPRASWPAKLTDGKAPAAEESPTHGQWARIDPRIDPEKPDPTTGKPWAPLTKLLIKAAQRYGLVSTDTNTWVHAFNTTSSHERMAMGLPDPWADGGAVHQHLGSLYVGDFPWWATQWAPVDWGRPASADPATRIADRVTRDLVPMGSSTGVDIPALGGVVSVTRADRLPPMLVVPRRRGWEDRAALERAARHSSELAALSDLPAPVVILDNGRTVEMSTHSFRRLLWAAYARAERKPEDGDYNPDWV